MLHKLQCICCHDNLSLLQCWLAEANMHETGVKNVVYCQGVACTASNGYGHGHDQGGSHTCQEPGQKDILPQGIRINNMTMTSIDHYVLHEYW